MLKGRTTDRHQTTLPGPPIVLIDSPSSAASPLSRATGTPMIHPT
jgi:hypothetical protein